MARLAQKMAAQVPKAVATKEDPYVIKTKMTRKVMLLKEILFKVKKLQSKDKSGKLLLLRMLKVP